MRADKSLKIPTTQDGLYKWVQDFSTALGAAGANYATYGLASALLASVLW